MVEMSTVISSGTHDVNRPVYLPIMSRPNFPASGCCMFILSCLTLVMASLRVRSVINTCGPRHN